MSGAAAVLSAALVLLDGRPVISEKDVSDYRAAQSCYGEGAISSRKAAFMRLLEGAIAEEAMRAHGGPALTEGDLQREADRIDRETRAPRVIACVKQRYAAPRDYLRGYVRLAWVESRLRTFLAYDPKVQARPHLKVRRAFDHVLRGASFAASAGELGLAYSSATYSPSDQPEFIRDHLARLPVDLVKAEPIETDYDLRLLRVLSKEGSRWTFESVSARKEGQADWFQTLPKMKLSIADEPLRRWIGEFKGNPRLAAVSLSE